MISNGRVNLFKKNNFLIKSFLNIEIGSSKSICSEVYAGASANSEFETVAITNFMLSKKPYWLSYISIHAFGAFWLHDWKDSISEDPNYNEEKLLLKTSNN